MQCNWACRQTNRTQRKLHRDQKNKPCVPQLSTTSTATSVPTMVPISKGTQQCINTSNTSEHATAVVDDERGTTAKPPMMPSMPACRQEEGTQRRCVNTSIIRCEHAANIVETKRGHCVAANCPSLEHHGLTTTKETQSPKSSANQRRGATKRKSPLCSPGNRSQSKYKRT